ncbi:histidine phosphatase family protein [Enterococcus sp. BWR-S5]|uniref:histidine phosphatase family protein n=1 Tax=Enterococcus sp. BWR-S5 TaxID=2787714 RepID=UPI001920D3B5|nr:histidine phosphatase family protein [Enterococcus sp. BWR-S5]MBL1227315.1 histidine phosphatase family protein [Enterococcus sp. BWR-S5]
MKRLVKLGVVSLVVGLLLAGCNSGDSGKVGTSETGKAAAEETVLYFVRHGKTMFNTTGQVQGWSDTPLTDVGVEGAEKLGQGLKGTTFTKAYSSDLGRAVSTAEYILKNSGNEKTELTTLSGIREWGYGGYEGRDNSEMWIPLFEEHGLTFDEDWTQYGELTRKMSDEEIANTIAENDETKTAETYDEITKRTEEALDQIIDETSEKGGNVLIVSHGSEIPTILELIAPGSYQGEDIGNCSVTKVVYKDGSYTVESIGDKSYLE